MNLWRFGAGSLSLKPGYAGDLQNGPAVDVQPSEHELHRVGILEFIN